ncbi:NIPSNAP family protein [Pedobacter sp. UC225_61]|uniref:NIPSNAP family protein n=1 Tax=Pedobacter sp. UC225_61 TaxID=3374623 RepID=UPI0037AD6C40
MRLKLCFSLLLILLVAGTVWAQSPYYYQLKVYHLKGERQRELTESYLRDAYLPALHSQGFKSVGVFKPIALDTVEQLIYVFIPAQKLNKLVELEKALSKDKNYLIKGKAYLDATYNQAPYLRIENIILEAFKGMPAPKLPKLSSPKAERVYELRSYEAATEKLSNNKINMFNEAEMDIFTKLDFNAIFYGQVIAGSHMPNLMYLTSFNNKADRDKHWAAFGVEYKKISGLPQYQHNVSKNTTLFLYPTDYSDY